MNQHQTLSCVPQRMTDHQITNQTHQFLHQFKVHFVRFIRNVHFGRQFSVQFGQFDAFDCNDVTQIFFVSQNVLFEAQIEHRQMNVRVFQSPAVIVILQKVEQRLFVRLIFQSRTRTVKEVITNNLEVGGT